jgi:hypothetical protein
MELRYSDFKLEDLFACQVGDVDIQQKHMNGNGHFVVNSGATETGIKGKSDIPARVFASNTITVDMFGLAFFRNYEYKMATHGHVFSLSLKSGKLTVEAGLYIVAAMSYFQQVFTWSNMLNWNKIKAMTICLPICENGEIDFAYMESYIRELEGARIRELEAYLEVTGLIDYRLTPDEQAFMNEYARGG